MVWLAVDKDSDETIYEEKPFRNIDRYWASNEDTLYIILPKGSIEKLIGKTLTWEDEPVEI